MDLQSVAGKQAWQELKRKQLDSLINSKLLQQQAVEMKLTIEPAEIERAIDDLKKQNNLDDAGLAEALKQQGQTVESYRQDMRRQLLEFKVQRELVRARVHVDDDEVKAYYEQNARQLSGERSYHLRQILIALPKNPTAAEVERKQALGGKVVSSLRSGQQFVDLAKLSDDESTKSSGGDLGWLPKNSLAEPLDQVVGSMDDGDVRGPIRTARGFLVLQLVEHKTNDLRPFNEVKEQLKRTLMDQQAERARDAWLKEARKKAHIELRL